MRKSVAAAAMAASLTVGGAAGAALFVPNVSGAQTDDPPADEAPEDTDRPERGAFLADALASLVEDGTIDQSQADAVIAAVQEARPDGFGHHGHRGRGVIGDALTDVLGITADDLRAALVDGQTIAEIAEANGVPVDDVVAALVARAEERLEHVTDLVNGEFELGDHRGHRDGPSGGGDDAGDETTGS